LNGTQTLTIFKSIKTEAYMAAEMAYNIANGKKPENLSAKTNNGEVDVPTYLINPVLITKANLKEFFAKEGIYSEKEIYQQ